jgi:hypothetical protein
VGREQGEGPWVGLAEAVNGVRAELESAQETAERSNLKFEVGSVEMEFVVDLREDQSSSAGVDVRVLSLGRARNLGLTDTHRLKITLHPKDGRTHKPVSIADDEPDLPPR